MKPTYRLFRRKRTYYAQHNETGEQKSLHTSDKGEAQRLLNSKNEGAQNPGALNRQIGGNYLAMSGDPDLATRTWKDVLDRMLEGRTGSTRERLDRAGKDKAYEPLWNRPLLETKPDELMKVMESGTVATNVFLRRMHNFAFDMDWLPVRIVSKRQWKKIVYGETRAITEQEHLKIIEKELNRERRAFYQLCWYTGGSQGDVASLGREDIDCDKNTIRYRRRKTAVDVLQKMGPKVKSILAELPMAGLLFPHLKDMRASDRATEFKRACRRAGVSGVTLHSYLNYLASLAKRTASVHR